MDLKLPEEVNEAVLEIIEMSNRFGILSSISIDCTLWAANLSFIDLKKGVVSGAINNVLFFYSKLKTMFS